MEDRPFPACVDGCHGPLYGVIEKDRNAVRGPDSYGYPGEGRHEGIVAFQFLPCHPRTVHDGYPAAVHLVTLGDRVGKDGIPFGGEGLHAFAEVVSEERVKHAFLKNVREVSVFRENGKACYGSGGKRNLRPEPQYNSADVRAQIKVTAKVAVFFEIPKDSEEDNVYFFKMKPEP